MSTINLVQGDTGPQIKTTITREDTGEVIDMSGGTVRLKVRKRGAATLSFTLTALRCGERTCKKESPSSRLGPGT